MNSGAGGERRRLRAELRSRRCAVKPQVRRQASDSLARQLSLCPWFLTSRRLAAYLPNDGEIDLGPALLLARAYRKQCYLPVLMFDRLLRFAPYRPGDRLSRNRFGIGEPASGRRFLQRAATLDLVLLPLVACDLEGNRLGRGAGFYDRSLAFRLRTSGNRPRLVGVGYEFQTVRSIQAMPWDVPLDALVTEKAVYSFR